MRMTRPVIIACLLGLLVATFAGAEQITSARYSEPVTRYGHFALGRPHEYAQLIATIDTGDTLRLALPADEVFEDLAPRLVNLNDQAPTQLLVIISSVRSGARLGLVGVAAGQLAIVAQSAPIGTPNRWMNPVGVADLDGDGEAEIAAVITPHIGGVLTVYRRDRERLVAIDSMTGFSNHVYGSAELGLSMPAQIGGQMHLLVPDVQRTAVRAIRLTDEGLVETQRCRLGEPVQGTQALTDCKKHFD
jgi:hypothetical protein